MHRSHDGSLGPATALAALVVLAASAPAGASSTRFGHVDASDGVLRPGCHRYGYHYVAKPRSDDWMLETWLYDPRGRPRGAGDFAPGSDPRRGHASFGICRTSVVPGRFTVRARLRWYTPGALPVSPAVEHTRWFTPAHFRLRRS
jgi:hypothetical protein